MKYTYNFDLNTMLLYGVLNSMTIYNYNKEIDKRLHDFISYLEKLVYIDDFITPDTDIISQEYQCIIKYKKEVNNGNL